MSKKRSLWVKELSCKGWAFPPTQSATYQCDGHAQQLWAVKNIEEWETIQTVFLHMGKEKKITSQFWKYPFQVNDNHLLRKERTPEMLSVH